MHTCTSTCHFVGTCSLNIGSNALCLHHKHHNSDACCEMRFSYGDSTVALCKINLPKYTNTLHLGSYLMNFKTNDMDMDQNCKLAPFPIMFSVRCPTALCCVVVCCVMLSYVVLWCSVELSFVVLCCVLLCCVGCCGVVLGVGCRVKKWGHGARAMQQVRCLGNSNK